MTSWTLSHWESTNKEKWKYHFCSTGHWFQQLDRKLIQETNQQAFKQNKKSSLLGEGKKVNEYR